MENYIKTLRAVLGLGPDISINIDYCCCTCFEEDNLLQLDGYVMQRDINTYIVCVEQNGDLITQLATIAHEMKHIQQLHSGQLKHTDDYGYIWNGVKLPILDDYSDCRHEIEAREFAQDGLTIAKILKMDS